MAFVGSGPDVWGWLERVGIIHPGEPVLRVTIDIAIDEIATVTVVKHAPDKMLESTPILEGAKRVTVEQTRTVEEHFSGYLSPQST